MENFKKQKLWVAIKVAWGILLALLIPLAGTLMTDAPAVWPFSTLVYSFGLLLFFANITKRAASTIVYIVFAAAFFVVEASFFFSYYLQNAGFNDAFFYHLRPDMIYAGLGEHLFVLILVFASLFGFLFLTSSSFHLARARKSRVIPFSLCLLLSGFYLSPPAKALVLDFSNRLSAVEATTDLYQQFPELSRVNYLVRFDDN